MQQRTYVCTYVRTYTKEVRTYVRTVRTYVCMFARMYVYMYVCTYVRTYVRLGFRFHHFAGMGVWDEGSGMPQCEKAFQTLRNPLNANCVRTYVCAYVP